jgi:hypothetical protein
MGILEMQVAGVAPRMLMRTDCALAPCGTLHDEGVKWSHAYSMMRYRYRVGLAFRVVDNLTTAYLAVHVGNLSTHIVFIS